MMDFHFENGVSICDRAVDKIVQPAGVVPSALVQSNSQVRKWFDESLFDYTSILLYEDYDTPSLALPFAFVP
jgi:hypothetical protein